MVKLAGKPGSVVDSHSSGPHIAVRLKPPTRKLGGTRQRLPIRCCSGWRLPRFTPLNLHPADSSLWPYSSPHGGRALPVTLPCGARTFLYARHVQVALSGLFRTQRLPGQLRRECYHGTTLYLMLLEPSAQCATATHAPMPAGDANVGRAPPLHPDGSVCSPDSRCWGRVRRNSRR